MADCKLQSIIFNKKSFTEQSASKWLKQNKIQNDKVDSKSHYYRFRQISPAHINKLGFNKYRMKEIGNGIYLVLALKGEKEEGGKLSVKHIKGFINNSYKKDADENIDNWALDKSLSNDYAKVYYDPETKRAVVIHRGTSGAADWLNNVSYVFGQYEKTNRYKTGKEVQEKAEAKYGANNVSTLGHSQGKVLASKLGKNSKEIINLNGADMGETLLNQGQNEYNIRSEGDLVSALQQPAIAIKSIFYPTNTANRNITISSEPVKQNPNLLDRISSVLTEHSPEILDRLDQDTEIVAGRCHSTNYKGGRCKYKAIKGSFFCRHHTRIKDGAKN
jgi:hypothetical protein